ncbi:metallophosphoesterase [Bradyrhizobium vignae]|uniref:Calcineurin-like phosphoesterase n=1 Tax=Bradyrhizobium vignae TaxID=1549949 RepID=A0A2U3PUM4_9BRAD|nr:metallophosphoesterase [Bradyrhizobium vignae]SPP92860.1 Calcineurin-like phosphoesterase [Bradyrhizobium vignae]
MRLRLQIASDLHIKHPGSRGFPPLARGVDIVLLAGDTCEGLEQAIREMRAAYPHTEIVTVAGNHEFYGGAYFSILEEGRQCARELGVHFLEDGVATFGSLRVIGATGWTDYNLFGPALKPAAMRAAYDTMRDHKRIRWQLNPWQRFRPVEASLLHARSRAFIEAELARTPAGSTTIVITHHAATVEAVAPAFRDKLITAAYASDLLPVIDRYQPDHWVWGHTHFPTDVTRGRTRLISNPAGYGHEVSDFDPSFVIEVDA